MMSETMLSATFAALADPTRRRILERLRAGERSVGELAEPLEMSWPAVSKHLKVLENAGLLVRRREGRRHLVTIDAGVLREADQWLSYYRKFWQDGLDRLADYLENEPVREEKS